MPSYLFTCGDEHETVIWRSIHAKTLRVTKCKVCGRTARLTMTPPNIAADALPNKQHAVIAQNRRDEQFAKDHPAYARLRSNGVQPRQIDGAAEVEQFAGTVTEVEMGHQLQTVAKRRGAPIRPQEIRDAQEISAELLGKDVREEGKKIGDERRKAVA